MDLQVSQGFAYNNNNCDIITYIVIFAIYVFAISAFDYEKLKKDVNNDTQKTVREFEILKNRITDLETHVLGLEEKIGNINKNTNSALEQHLDYVNRQLLIQTATIEELNAKIMFETQPVRITGVPLDLAY